jgi:tRNA nucleotidyltransferase (CCA-adding enzyme)
VSTRELVGRGGEVLEALREQPAGAELLALGSRGSDVALVGGAVRDLLGGRTPRELDVVVADDAAGFARELAQLLGASAVLHERFGTALVVWEDGRVDVAARRAESYAVPGALPEVRAGTVAEDLARRDFTVNALAVALSGSGLGVLIGAEHALEDLAAGRLRVLHERSFSDDPTRLLRLARYRARLGFDVEPQTAALATAALASGALTTVSRARLGAELRLALGEADAPRSLAAMGELGVLAALPPGLRFDRELAARALTLLPPDGRADLLLMATLLLHLTMMPGADAEPIIFGVLDELEFTAADRERTMRTTLAAPTLVRELSVAHEPSRLYEALHVHTSEAIALAGALAGEEAAQASLAVAEWFGRLRAIRLQIGGEELIAAGIPAGPEIGRRLKAALARKLDGDLGEGPEAELEAALQAAQ